MSSLRLGRLLWINSRRIALAEILFAIPSTSSRVPLSTGWVDERLRNFRDVGWGPKQHATPLSRKVTSLLSHVYRGGVAFEK
ncbi:hypothetical protein BDW02DRAFT_573091 [Decorospora gaudefroyi]|uniref:Uncharacterized protein n=1 Tax=Decorospora gaudefroyi TaxID=184978 RepID=A0A6A5JZJ2_9PLEO|nr:hypothetical protein BDW02DRAFT_573091 [Decorospora gaudefroyi]